MLNWRLVQVWKLEETITQGHVQSILPLLVLHCMQNFDLVDIRITCAILGSFLCRSHKSGWNSNHSWAVHELFECVKLLRWRMGARLVTLYVESSSVDTSIHQQDFNLHTQLDFSNLNLEPCHSCRPRAIILVQIYVSINIEFSQVLRVTTMQAGWNQTIVIELRLRLWAKHNMKVSAQFIHCNLFIYTKIEFHTTKWSTLGISMQQACS